MVQRCTDANHDDFARYGGRGIKVCKRWRESFEHFLADMGERPLGMTLDRKKSSGDYTPENCKWATATEQQRNRRNTKLDGEAITRIREWLIAKVPQRWIAFHFGLHQTTVSEIKLGKIWS